MKTPTLTEIQARVPYTLRADLPMREKPYRCHACGQHHSYVGAENDLPARNTSKRAVFCPVCVANGAAVAVIKRAIKA